jgi:hypothetical protein
MALLYNMKSLSNFFAYSPEYPWIHMGPPMVVAAVPTSKGGAGSARDGRGGWLDIGGHL